MCTRSSPLQLTTCTVKEDPDGRSRGYGFVNFEDPALVEQVMAQQDHVIDGRKVSPRPIFQVASLERSCK